MPSIGGCAIMAFEFGFREKILLSVAGACLICAGGAAFVSTHQVHDVEVEDLQSKSEAILSRLESARNFVANQGQIESLIERAVEDHPSGTLPKDVRQQIFMSVPIVASMKIGADNAVENNYEFRVTANDPRNPENEPTEKEEEFLSQFEHDPDLEQIVWENEDAEQLWVMRPIRLSEQDGCLLCHGHPSTSPWGNGKDILGYPMENWPDGQMHGMFAIRSDLRPAKARATAVAWTIVKWSLFLLFVAVAGSAVLVGRPLGRFVNLIRTTSSELTDIASELASSARAVRQNSDTLADGAARQAASLEETSAAVTELSASAEENAVTSQRAHATALEAKNEAESGSRDASGMRRSLGELREASNEMAEIIRTIESVAFQTKLLALNAGVEAARAGDAGKGFAVVADEVGTLAQKTAEAASKTDERIRRSMEMTKSGASAADQVSEGLERVQERVQSATEMVQHIAVASSEQSRTTAQVRTALTQIDQVTQQNAATAEEASSAANVLAEQADAIQSQIEGLRKLVGSGGAHSSATQSRRSQAPSIPMDDDEDGRNRSIASKLKFWDRAA